MTQQRLLRGDKIAIIVSVTVIVVAIVIIASVVVDVANAHRAVRVSPGSTVKELRRVEARQERNLAHYRGSVLAIQRVARARRAREERRLFVPIVVLSVTEARELRWHVRAARWTLKELDETRAKIRRLTTPVIGWPWIAIADCETGDSDGRPPYSANWSYNGSSGYDGGIQFSPSTWSSHAPRGYPPYAYMATPAQQVAVGKIVVGLYGWGQFPACARLLGLL